MHETATVVDANIATPLESRLGTKHRSMTVAFEALVGVAGDRQPLILLDQDSDGRAN